MRKILTGAALALLATAAVLTLFVGDTSTSTQASSHRESPLILGDPLADATDTYAFVSPDAPNTTTLIANWVPLEEPADGPNFYQFGDAPDYVYGIRIDNNGDAHEDIIYEWRFRTEVMNPDTFLYNTGPITVADGGLNDPNFNVRQVYTLTRTDVSTGQTTVLGTDLPTPPVNIGPRSIPDYNAVAAQAIVNVPGGGKAFAGQRDDPFFVDLGSLTDLLALRNPGSDTVSGFNTHTVALQIPSADLVRPECSMTDAADATNGECVIGVWSTTHRPALDVRTDQSYGGGAAAEAPKFGDIDCNGIVNIGDAQKLARSLVNLSVSQTEPCPGIGVSGMVQVSRLGNPLVNEVVIPVGKKDAFNASQPKDDAQFASTVTDPETAKLLNLLYNGILHPIPETNRTDLVTVFLTGIPTVNQPPNVTASEELRLNVRIPPSATENPLGILGGDFAGFPNGRRLKDDVTDIALRAVACGYGAVYTVPAFSTFGPCDSATFASTPNNTTAVGDNVNANDVPFTSTFPYVAPPQAGFDHEHNQKNIATSILPAGMGALGLLLALAVAAPRLSAWIRRRRRGAV